MFDINLNDYDYELPASRIANFPLEERANSKLLFVEKKSGKIQHRVFRELPDLIPENSFLLVNSSKVISARIFVQKATGAKVEILCVEPVEPSIDPQIAMTAKAYCIWNCIIGGKKIKENSELFLKNDKLTFTAKIISKNEQNAVVKFEWNEDISFSELLTKIGHIPLPPYIKREDIESDKERYQTVYAEYEGSVAAPTAGLHFTDDVLKKIKNRNIEIANLILHVGPGTFKPIDTDNIAEHDMHSEMIIINRDTLQNIVNAIQENKYIIATGTTSMRTIESLYWLGVKNINSEIFQDKLEQWDCYNLEQTISPVQSFQKIIDYMNLMKIDNLSFRTSLLIVPGYKFKIVKGLITNFHLPKSTLILLVAAFIGKELWQKSYKEAMENEYRFLSYGDSSLLLT
jgi:S-adenosylmethionine:tRNA ribosyltransferase-isomerase